MVEEVFGSTPKFDSACFKFLQDGNTVGTTKQIEIIEIHLQTQLPGDEPFFVIKSETGWSFDSFEDIVELIKRCGAYWKY